MNDPDFGIRQGGSRHGAQRLARVLLGLGCLILSGEPARAGDPAHTVLVPVLLEDDLIAGVGRVVSIREVAVNASGQWAAWVLTTNSDPTSDEVLLVDGVVQWREGQTLVPGLVLRNLVSLDLNEFGETSLGLYLGDGGPFMQDSAITFQSTLLAHEGDGVFGSGFPAGATYIRFFDAVLNEAGQLLVKAQIDPDPSNPLGGLIVALLLWDVDDSGVLAESIVVQTGDVLPGQTGPVGMFSTVAAGRALDSAGRAMYSMSVSTTGHTAVYLDDTLLIQEGDPIVGTNQSWGNLLNLGLDLNDVGDWIAVDGSADLSATVLAVNGTKLVQTGDAWPAPGGFLINYIDLGPRIGDNGNVLWRGIWDDPDATSNQGLFLNDRLLVQTGVTQVGGVPLSSIFVLTGQADLSDDGGTVLFVAQLSDGTDGLFRVDVDQWADLGNSLAGTAGQAPTLSVTDTLSAGATLTVTLTQALPGALAHFVLGFSTMFLPLKGGVLVPSPDLLLAGLPLDPTGKLVLGLPVPQPLPSGVDVTMQLWVSDPGGPAGFAASNALTATTD